MAETDEGNTTSLEPPSGTITIILRGKEAAIMAHYLIGYEEESEE